MERHSTRAETKSVAPAAQAEEEDPFLEAVRGALKRLGYGEPNKGDADRAKESS
jgi:hypothetical protein